VLVTGASGFIGSHVVAALHAHSHEPVAFVRNPDRLTTALAPHNIGAVTHHVGDITDTGALSAAMIGCDAVIHTAGVASLTGADEDLMRRVNVDGTRAVLDAAIAAGLDPIIHISSVAALFPAPGPKMTSEDPVSEANSPYARTKAGAESVARVAQDAGHPVVIFYPGGVFGPHVPGASDLTEGNIMMLEKGAFILPTGGGNSFVDVRDLSEAIVRALAPRNLGPRRFMAGGHWTLWDEWVDAFRRSSGRRIFIIEVSAKRLAQLASAGDRLASRITKIDSPLSAESVMYMSEAKPTDDRRIADELGVSWRPLQESVDDFVDWLIADGRVSRATGKGRADAVIAKMVTSDLFRSIGPRVIPGMHRAMAKATRGKFVPGAGLVLTTTGAKSGALRQSPLETVPRADGTWLVIGSNWAQEHHPSWTWNLMKNPNASVLVSGKTTNVTARLLTGKERDEAWSEALEHWPAWSEYTSITNREFRIFSLAPVDSDVR